MKSTANKNFSITANPTENSTSFIISNMRGKKAEIAIYNIAGQKTATVFAGTVTENEQEATWNIPAQLPKGIYFAVLRSGQNCETIKIVKQ